MRYKLVGSHTYHIPGKHETETFEEGLVVERVADADLTPAELESLVATNKRLLKAAGGDVLKTQRAIAVRVGLYARICTIGPDVKPHHGAR